MKSFIRKICIFSILFAVIPYNVFGNQEKVVIPKENPTKTLKEMQENIQTLEKEKVRLEFKWNTFRIGNENLGDLIQLDLDETQISELETIITNYSILRSQLENNIDEAIVAGRDTEVLQEELSARKKDFYDALLAYIDTEKTSAFLSYIQSDLNFNEKSKEVATEIEVKESEKAERVEEIQDKIQDNAETLRIQIEEKIRLDLRAKLDVFIAQEKFQNLENNLKITLFEKLIEKIEVKKEVLLSTENPTSIIKERIIFMELVQDVISSYIATWKE